MPRIIELKLDLDMYCYICQGTLYNVPSTAFPHCPHGVHYHCVHTSLLFEQACPNCQLQAARAELDAIDNQFFGKIYLQILDAECTRYQSFMKELQMEFDPNDDNPVQQELNLIYHWYVQLHEGYKTPVELHDQVTQGLLLMPQCLRDYLLS